MRRVLWWGFPLTALCAALIAPWNDAGAQELPSVVCEHGVCKMSEEDWKKLQKYHKAVIKGAEKMQQQMAGEYQAWANLAQRLQSCMAILEERKV